MDDLIKIKNSLKTRFQQLMSNLLSLTLRKGEDKLTLIITVEYEFILEEEMIILGLSADNYDWLYHLWAINKNFIGNRMNSNACFITYE